MKTSLKIASFLCLASLAIGCGAPAGGVANDGEGETTSNLGASASASAAALFGTWTPADNSFRLSLASDGTYALDACENADCSQATSETGTWTGERHDLQLTPSSETRVAKPVSRDFAFMLSDGNQKLFIETNQSIALPDGHPHGASAPAAPPAPAVHEVFELSRVNAS